METKHINTLAQLRNAKQKLKHKMSVTDAKMENNIVYSLLNKLFGKSHNKKLQDKLGEGTVNAINFVAHQAGRRFRILKAGKIILPILLAIAAPVIAKKISNL